MTKYSTIEAFFLDQDPDKLNLINSIRKVIIKTEPNLIETLKWNALNYVYNGEDRITFNVMNKDNKVIIVIHMGATKKENKKGKPVLKKDQGIVKWNSDIRRTIEFENVKDVIQKKSQLKQVIIDWLKIV